jgi:hypothetical protein
MRLMNFSLWLIVFCFLCSSHKAMAQAEQRISINVSEVSFVKLIEEIEKVSSYRFYFDPAETDSLRWITVKADNASLSFVLDQALQNSGLQYAVDQQNHVYITKKYKIQTALPTGFFEKKKTSKDSLANVVPIPVLEETGGDKEKFKASLEKKLFEIGPRTNAIGKGNAIVVGYVRDIKNGEALSGAVVYVDTPAIKSITDQFGYYSITLPKGRHTLHINSVSMKETKRELVVYSDGKLNVELEDYVASLKAVTVTSDRRSNIRSTQMGVEKLNVRTIKQVPTVLGEADILRVVLTLPGVTSVGEASTGFNVRGGAADQNLILLNDATIYNPSHLFGFFSAFNTDVVKGVELYKSAIPEKYGGRLSSVLDVSTRDGNSKKVSGTGGIGVLTSRLTLEGPINKEKTTFILGGRTTYSNWVLKQIPNSAYANSSASFYDLNLNITHTINPKNTIYLTGYYSRDNFKLNSDTLYKYGNQNAIVKWKHIFSNQLYAVVSAGIDRYDYSVSSDIYPLNAFKLAFDINQTHFRTEFNYNPNNKHALTFGIHSIYYKIHPGSYQPNSSQSLVTTNEVSAEQARESAIYIGDRYNITPDFSINAGIRYSFYNYLGAHDVYKYAPGSPRTVGSITDTMHYGAGENIKTYSGPEIRVAMRYSLSTSASVKLSFNTLRQYIHTLSNTTAISPTDVWKLSDPNIPPQQGYQVSLGYYKNFSDDIETSVEVYYKHMDYYLDYKSGASLIMNKHIETDVINTEGQAYGAEFMIKKTAGKLNGWLSYTFSSTRLKMNDPIAGETINKGEYYPANFDKPHNVNFIGNYKFSHRLSLSLNAVYSTGRPITLPIALFNQAGSQRVYYSDRNQYRIPDYIRADISVNIEGSHKIKKLAHSSWSIGVYNMFARENPYSVYFAQENGKIKGYQLSIFGTAIPFITYNFKF